jgi:hypothetical protein
MPRIEIGASPRNSDIKRRDPLTPLYEISDFANRWVLSFNTNLPNLWKLLCICGQEMRFMKTQLKWYEVSREALGRGVAVQGEWKATNEVTAKMQDSLEHQWTA